MILNPSKLKTLSTLTLIRHTYLPDIFKGIGETEVKKVFGFPMLYRVLKSVWFYPQTVFSVTIVVVVPHRTSECICFVTIVCPPPFASI